MDMGGTCAWAHVVNMHGVQYSDTGYSELGMKSSPLGSGSDNNFMEISMSNATLNADDQMYFGRQR